MRKIILLAVCSQMLFSCAKSHKISEETIEGEIEDLKSKVENLESKIQDLE